MSWYQIVDTQNGQRILSGIRLMWGVVAGDMLATRSRARSQDGQGSLRHWVHWVGNPVPKPRNPVPALLGGPLLARGPPPIGADGRLRDMVSTGAGPSSRHIYIACTLLGNCDDGQNVFGKDNFKKKKKDRFNRPSSLSSEPLKSMYRKKLIRGPKCAPWKFYIRKIQDVHFGPLDVFYSMEIWIKINFSNSKYCFFLIWKF